MARRRYDEPREPRRKPGRSGGSAKVWILLLVGLPLLLMLIGGGVGLVFFLRGDRESLADRFEGEWEATAPEAEWLKLTLTVGPKQFTLAGTDTRSGRTGSETIPYEVISHARDKLVIRLNREDDPPSEWTILFRSENEILQKYNSGKTPDRVYRRTRPRDPAAQRQSKEERSKEKWRLLESGRADKSDIAIECDGFSRVMAHARRVP